MRLAGRRVLITGAASGIGRATAELFTAEGAAVALVDRDAAGLESAAAACRSAVPPAMTARVVATRADVALERDVERAVIEAVSGLDGLDGVVNAAGVDLVAPLERTTFEDWSRVVAANLTGPFLVCRAALPALKEAGGGTVVNVASGAGLTPVAHRTAYCASKAGVVMLAKALAIEAAEANVRVNVVCPGIVDTPMFRASWEGAADPAAELETIKQRYAMRRVGQPVEIARAILYLTSDDSSFVTGAALAVDGGRTFH